VCSTTTKARALPPFPHRLIHVFGIFAAAWVLSSAASHAQPPAFEYRGTCDASAAVSLGADHFIVANDEDNALRVYRFGSPDPVSVIELSEFAQPDPYRPEMDIEAAAKIGNRIYWITSHGANREGKYRPARRRLFATDISFEDGKPRVVPAGEAFADLLEVLSATARLKRYDLENAAEIAPKDHGGLNIEGLAATPGGALLIGFRNPIPGGKALVVTISNPAEVARGKKPAIGALRELPLGGLGIRAMERNNDHYLIVAGPSATGGPFRLFRWLGPSQSAPPAPLPDLNLEGLNPEAVFISPDGSIHILSDDGTKELDGVACKDQEAGKRRFRATVIKP
jgi:hypothetical protein